jgi:hypothetical protein
MGADNEAPSSGLSFDQNHCGCLRDRFFNESLPGYEIIFDDLEYGPMGPLLQVQSQMWNRRLGLTAHGQQNEQEERRHALIDMISRRRANLSRIYENLAPFSVTGEPR